MLNLSTTDIMLWYKKMSKQPNSNTKKREKTKLQKFIKKNKGNFRKAIISFSKSFVVLTLILVALLLLNLEESDKTTRPVSGTVTDVQLRTYYTYRTRTTSKIYITLEDGTVKKFNYNIFKYNGMDYGSFKNAVLGKSVNIRYSVIRRETIRYLEVEGNEIISYDYSNNIRNGYIPILCILYGIFVLFAAFFTWLKYIGFYWIYI